MRLLINKHVGWKVGLPAYIGNRPMHRKMPHENLNTGHAAAEEVRDAKQFMPSCTRTTGAFCRVAPNKQTAGVGTQGS